jgi:hypothetical protein
MSPTIVTCHQRHYRQLEHQYNELKDFEMELYESIRIRHEPHINALQRRLQHARTDDYKEELQHSLDEWTQFFDSRVKQYSIERSLAAEIESALSSRQPSTPPQHSLPDTSLEATPRPPGGFIIEEGDEPTPPQAPSPSATMVEKFKAPKPNVYSGDNAERDAAKLDTWIQKVKDYLALSGITDEQDKILTVPLPSPGASHSCSTSLQILLTSAVCRSGSLLLPTFLCPGGGLSHCFGGPFFLDPVAHCVQRLVRARLAASLSHTFACHYLRPECYFVFRRCLKTSVLLSPPHSITKQALKL